MHQIFGIKENAAYHDRRGAYLIPCRDGQIGVIKTPRGYFLLGGGLDENESHLACIHRECIEEAGYVPAVEGMLCSAESYMDHPTLGYFHPIQTYYYGKLLEKVAEPTEADHQLCWVDLEKIKGHMVLEMQNWALMQLAPHAQ